VDIYKRIVRPALFAFNPEFVHHAAIWGGAKLGRVRMIRQALDRRLRVQDEILASRLWDIAFDNPIGLAAGYDKSGEAIPFLESFGFGHIEIGSVSADPSLGNPKPRLFRLPEDEAIVVHYGLQNEGAKVISKRLANVSHQTPLGINIVKTNRGINAPADNADVIIDDYVRSLRLLKGSGKSGRPAFRSKGGVDSAEAAYEKIRLGASMVQLLTALVYQGPTLVAAINQGLANLLRRDGFSHISEAVGSAHSSAISRSPKEGVGSCA